jgi:hypothetical protein
MPSLIDKDRRGSCSRRYACNSSAIGHAPSSGKPEDYSDLITHGWMESAVTGRVR